MSQLAPSDASPRSPNRLTAGEFRLQRRITWATVLIPLLGALVGLWQLATGRAGARELAILGVAFLFAELGLGVGFHRFLSHHSFQAVAPVRYALAVLGSMCAEGPLLFWVALHRRHHRYSDHVGDPHSPHLAGPGLSGRLRGLLHAHVGWLFEHEAIDWGRWVPDLVRDPGLFLIHQLYLVWIALGLVVPAGVVGLWLGSWEGALTGLVWGGLIRIFVAHHVTWGVNSFGHVYGAMPFHAKGQARNNALLALVTLGDGWHNNHHAFPSSAAHGLRWWEVDLNYALIKGLALVGLAWDVKRPSDATVQRALARQEALGDDAAFGGEVA